MKFDLIQHLRESIASLEEKNQGTANPFVEGLKAQLWRLEKMERGKHAPNPMSNTRHNGYSTTAYHTQK